MFITISQWMFSYENLLIFENKFLVLICSFKMWEKSDKFLTTTYFSVNIYFSIYRDYVHICIISSPEGF